MKPVIVTKELISVGLPVMRGRDWIYSDQDGGAGKKGKVVALEDDNGPGWCSVEWDSGSRYCYRVGESGNHDLYVYAPGFYGTITPGKVRLNYQNSAIGLKVELNSDATFFAKDKLQGITPLIIEKFSSMAVAFKGVRGEYKFESFDICKDQTETKVDPAGPTINVTGGGWGDSSKFGYTTPAPTPLPKEEPIFKFRKGDVVYLKPGEKDSWTVYGGIKESLPYLVEDIKGTTMKLNHVLHWQAQRQFISQHDWLKLTATYAQTRLDTTPMMDMRDLQQNVVSIAENSKPNIKQNGINTDNPDYSGRPLELPSIIISLERGERIEGTRLHS